MTPRNRARNTILNKPYTWVLPEKPEQLSEPSGGNDGILTLPNGRQIRRSEHHPKAIKLLELARIFDKPHLANHIPRYLHTITHMPHGKDLRLGNYNSALEVGATFYFPLVLKDMFGFERVDFTDMTRKGDTVSAVNLPHDWTPRTWLSINVNLEEERLPVPDGTYDLVLCLEVIEHLEKDPMAMLNEINRVLKESGLIYLTTPNATSARNVLKIHRGYAPHFFMQYSHAVELGKHNIEYDPTQVLSLLNGAGFKIRKLWTEDLFENPVPEAMEILRRTDGSLKHRGDNLLVIAEKVGEPRERFPRAVYY
jgi:SAM-dependent methyltransferase